jgi:hypothetical protein
MRYLSRFVCGDPEICALPVNWMCSGKKDNVQGSAVVLDSWVGLGVAST